MQDQRDLAEMANTLAQICTYIDCQTTCAKPAVVEECGSDEPMKLMRELIKQSLGVFVD